MAFKPHPTDELAIKTLRCLAPDVVAKSNSGHPGAPMGMAPIAHLLWSRFFRFANANEHWPNRDRFVLSNGHACVLQYMMTHLMGLDLTMDDLKNFRQFGSKTPGHPEKNHGTPGVEVTTGPLGQGFTNGVGLAIAQANAAATFNKDGFPLFTNKTYVFLGDGCLMEGMTSEAASLAGHLKLGNLICIYDDNHVSIDGDTACSFTEDVEQRFLAYDWHVLAVNDGDKDLAGMYKAIEEAQKVTDKPTLIRLKTTIGFGSKLQGGAATHGAPLKADDIAQLKQKFGFDPEKSFYVPDEVYAAYKEIGARGNAAEAEWNKLFSSYASKFPKEHAELARRIAGKLPAGWEKALPTFKTDDAAVASRKLSEGVLSKLSAAIPEMMGGSADLTGSNLTRWGDAVDFQHPSTHLGDYSGRYIRYGVREHAMGAIMNGIEAYGLNYIPTAGTFLNFVLYGVPALRLAALSKQRVIWVATHDSIGLGEDGPTHQPIEIGPSLRSIPNVMFWRPADGNETSAAYKVAIESTGTPSVLALSRQNLKQLPSSIEQAAKGGYVLVEAKDAAITLVATGSEVATCVDAATELKSQGIVARVVSMPCTHVFDKQPLEYRRSVLPSGVPAMSVEVYSALGWSKYTHVHFSLDRFGLSAPAAKIFETFGFTPKGVAAKAAKAVAHFKKAGVPVVSPVELATVLDD